MDQIWVIFWYLHKNHDKKASCELLISLIFISYLTIFVCATYVPNNSNEFSKRMILILMDKNDIKNGKNDENDKNDTKNEISAKYRFMRKIYIFAEYMATLFSKN